MKGSGGASERPPSRIFQAPDKPEPAFRRHCLTNALFVGLPRFELGTFGPPDRSGLIQPVSDNAYSGCLKGFCDRGSPPPRLWRTRFGTKCDTASDTRRHQSR